MISQVYLELSTGSMTNFAKHKSCLSFLNPVFSDTLLNVFLAIAVDNLANAQELTKVKHNFSVSDSPFIHFLLIIICHAMVSGCQCCTFFLFSRMNKRKRRPHHKSLLSRKRKKWQKWAHCLLLTSLLLRELLYTLKINTFTNTDTHTNLPSCLNGDVSFDFYFS